MRPERRGAAVAGIIHDPNIPPLFLLVCDARQPGKPGVGPRQLQHKHFLDGIAGLLPPCAEGVDFLAAVGPASQGIPVERRPQDNDGERKMAL